MTFDGDINEYNVSSEIKIKRADLEDAIDLQKLAIRTFLESHSHSASAEDIQAYIDTKFTLENLQIELKDDNNLFYSVYFKEELIGYSKIILNSVYNELTGYNSCKMERLYVLQKYHGSQIGKILMDFNIQLAKINHQIGIWLYVWTENKRAIRFYKKYGFVQIDETVFQISKNHSNPNFIFQKSDL